MHDRRSRSDTGYRRFDPHATSDLGGHAVPGRQPAAAVAPVQARGASAPARPQPTAKPPHKALLSAGGGQALPPQVQARMERALGADFSAVRIHQGERAAAMGAHAYTQGTDIHFAPGMYDPESQHGLELLGHELTHVVQQRQGRVRAVVQASGVALNDDAALEREADELGNKAARGESVREALGPVPGAGGGPVIQRASALDEFRTSSTRKVDELTLLYGSRQQVLFSTVMSIGPDLGLLGSWKVAGNAPEDFDKKLLEVKSSTVQGAMATLIEIMGPSFDWEKWCETGLVPLMAGVEDRPDLFDEFAAVLGTSCGDIVNMLRPLFLVDQPDKAIELETIHLALMRNTLTDKGQHVAKQVPSSECVAAGVGPASLRDHMHGCTAPTYIQIHIGRAHTYVLELEAREPHGQLTGYRHEAFFGAHSMASFVGHQPSGAIDLSPHLDQLDAYTVKDPEKEKLRERALARAWAVTTAKKFDGKAGSLARLVALEHPEVPLTPGEEVELKALQREHGTYNGGVRALSAKHQELHEAAKKALLDPAVTGELSKEDSLVLEEYVAQQKSGYEAMFFHPEDDKVNLNWTAERREIVWTATSFTPKAVSDELHRKLAPPIPPSGELTS